FYFAEGYTGPGFREFLTVANTAGISDAVVTLMYEDGSSRDVALTIPPESRATLDVNQVAGEGKSVSARVVGDTGVVAAERPMYFEYAGWTGGHCVMGAPAPASAWYFAEGTCRTGFDPYFTILNPGEREAAVTITYMLGDATTRQQALAVSGRSRATVRVTEWLGIADDAAHDFSAKIESDGGGIVVERPVYFDNHSWTGGHCVLGATEPSAIWYLAEGTTRAGFESYITVQNPARAAAEVSITYMTEGGNRVQSLRVAGRARSTIRVSDFLKEQVDFSAKVQAWGGASIVVERPVYFDHQGRTGGHCVVGATFADTVWDFAEGSSRPGFAPFVTIFNPWNAATSVVLYCLPGDDSGARSQTVAVGPYSRSTVDVAALLGTGDDAAHDFSLRVVSSGTSIVVERVMYFRYGTWDGGHCVLGRTPSSGPASTPSGL
ncbi:MAG: hypothetical protein ACYC55_00250, partial [Candidatus Geothermincolia bacterium]